MTQPGTGSEPPQPSDQERRVDEERREIERGVFERRSIPTPDVQDGGVQQGADYMDEGDPSFGAHQGANHTNRELHSRGSAGQGAKTRAAHKDIVSRRGT